MASFHARETIRMAFDSLRANRTRSALTILGVVIGVTTVIAISSVINGLNNHVADFAKGFGTDTIFAFHLPIDVQPTAEMLARKRLTEQEAYDMRKLPHVIAVDPTARHQDPMFNVGQEAVKYRNRSVQSTLLEGATEQMSETNAIPLTAGHVFNADQVKSGANVVVLGPDTVSKLFNHEDPVGKEVQIAGSLFTVIGVMGKSPQLFGSGENPQDNIAIFPLTTFHKLHPEDKDIWISVRYDEAKNQALVEDEMRTLLRIARKVPEMKDDDFSIFTPDAIVRLWGQITGGLVLFMIAVSSVGLMVGGVGVMNIMLVSVTERTREIGVRKAIGATRGSIMLQFTSEAIVLCAVGGILGILVGALITFTVRFTVSALPASMSVVWTVVAFSMSCLIGLLFGIYPAWKAATLNPIEALRYE